MLTEYLEATMRHAQYEQMEDGAWFGRIPGFSGLWADGATEAECCAALRSTLEDWIIFSLGQQLPIPVVDGIDLTITEVA